MAEETKVRKRNGSGGGCHTGKAVAQGPRSRSGLSRSLRHPQSGNGSRHTSSTNAPSYWRPPGLPGSTAHYHWLLATGGGTKAGVSTSVWLGLRERECGGLRVGEAAAFPGVPGGQGGYKGRVAEGSGCGGPGLKGCGGAG